MAWHTVVPQSMVGVNHLTSALTPLGTADVAELGAANTCDVVTTRLLLDHMPTLETAHPIHGNAELGNRIFGFSSNILVLLAIHTRMPLALAPKAQSLLALWAAV